MLWGSVSGPDVVLVVLAGPEVHSAPLSARPPFLSKEFASTYRKQKAKKKTTSCFLLLALVFQGSSVTHPISLECCAELSGEVLEGAMVI